MRNALREQLPSSQIVKEQPKCFDAEETPSSRVTVCCSLSCLAPGFTGGANRDRTGDLLLAKQALSQLSYGPVDLPPMACRLPPFSCWFGGSGWIRTIDPRLIKTVL